MQENEITIVPVANGFIVYLPYQGIDPTMQMFDAIGKNIPNLMEKIQRDPTLGRIEDEMNQKEAEKPLTTLAKRNNVFIFETFIEVLGFLQKTFATKDNA